MLAFGISMSLILTIAYYILLVIGYWKMFEKGGEPGWKALIPLYNWYILFKMCWKTDMFWAYAGFSIAASVLWSMNVTGFLFYIALALTLVAAIIRALAYYNISLAFGHGIGFFLGLYFLEPIFFMIIGYGSSRYQGPVLNG